MVAYNYRMPNLNAALGCSQLEDLPQFLKSKRQIATDYINALQDREELTVLTEPLNCTSNYWLNAILLSHSMAEYHDQIIEALHEAKIMVRPIWEPMHTLPMFKDSPRMKLEVTENLATRVINLPSTPRIESEY